MLLRGAWKAPDLQDLQRTITGLSPAQKELLREVAVRLAMTGTHDLLFALHEEADGAVQVLVDGKNVAKLSDGLHGEIFGDDGPRKRADKKGSGFKSLY